MGQSTVQLHLKGKTLHQKTTFPNGLRILTESMPHTHSVCIAVFVGTGSRYESDQEAGVSHFIEHLCFRGTPSRPEAKEISEAIEGVGGLLNGATDKELTFYWCKVATAHFKGATEVLADMLLHSLFRPEDIEKERQIIIEEINMCKDSPSQQVSQLAEELMWPGHPLGRDIAGTRESIGSMTRQIISDYFQAKYTPQNAVLAVAGDVSHEEVIQVAGESLGNWTAQTPPNRYLAYHEKPGEPIKIEKRDTEQAHLCLSLPGLSLFHPQRFSLDLLNVILGEGMSSRLFCEVRDKLGLAYSISSFVEHFLDTGALTVAASVDPGNLGKTITAISKELARVKENIPEKEMQKAREISKGRLLLRMEDSRNVAGWLGGQEMLMNKILTVEEVVEIIDRTTASDLRQVAQDLLLGEKLKLAVVGPIENSNELKELLVI